MHLCHIQHEQFETTTGDLGLVIRFLNFDCHELSHTCTWQSKDGHAKNCLNIWWFPEIGVPPNHPFLDGIFPYKPTILGYPIYGNPHLSSRFVIAFWGSLQHGKIPMKFSRPVDRPSVEGPGKIPSWQNSPTQKCIDF